MCPSVLMDALSPVTIGTVPSTCGTLTRATTSERSPGIRVHSVASHSARRAQRSLVGVMSERCGCGTLRLANICVRVTGHRRSVNSIAFSPDGTTLASGNGDSTVRLWNVLDGELLRTLTEHRRSVNSVAFSPDGAKIASASYGSRARLWDADTGNHLFIFDEHTGSVNSVAFHPDGRAVASAGRDSLIRLWDASTGKQLKTLVGHTGAVGSIAFSPDGATLASASHRTEVYLWDTATGDRLHTLSGHTNNVRSVAFSPDGVTLAGGSSKEIHLWDVATGNHLRTLAGHARSVSSIAFSPDGRTLVSGSWDGTVLLWEITASTGDAIGVESSESRITTLGNIKRTALLQNYPNPFNPETWIPYQLEQDTYVTLTIYDQSGNVVRTLGVGHQKSGVYQDKENAAFWDGRNQHGEPVTSGTYYYQLHAGDYTALRRMVIVK